jgi:hypothetical protein
MKKHVIFICAVLVVFAALILSRIPALLENNLDPVTLVSTLVEAAFVIWGLVVLRK